MFNDLGYTKLYDFYRKIPLLLTITVAITFFIWSIVDVSVFTIEVYDRNYYGQYDYVYKYGIFQNDSLIIELLIWWIIGAIVCFLTWFFTALSVAPTIVRTDAVLSIDENIKKQYKLNYLNASSSKTLNSTAKFPEETYVPETIIKEKTRVKMTPSLDYWICSECGTTNSKYDICCNKCGLYK